MSNTIINTNVLALNSHRALTGVGGQVAKSSERLSSGMRINRAADDAAGLAISEKMRSQIRGLDQATRNSQDGISLIQTAEGALQESQNMLQKMRELTVQASNETNTESDRDKIAGEIDELINEIDATAEKTEFNTKKLIDGSWKNSTIYLQTGANAEQGMEFNIEQMDAITLGTTKGSISSVIRGNGVDGALAITTMTDSTIESKEMQGTFTFAGGASVEVLENGDINVSGMTIGGAEAEDTYKLADIQADPLGTGKFTLTDEDGGTFEINIADLEVTVTGAAGATSGATITIIGADANVGTGNTGTAEFDVGSVKATYEAKADDFDTDFATSSTDATITFENTEGAIFLKADGTEATIEEGKAYTFDDIAAAGITSMVDKNGDKFVFDPATGAFADSTKSIGFIASSDEAKALTEDLGVTGQSSGKVISGLTETIDAALETVSSQRAKLGAYQNRLDYTINNLKTSSENLSASESRIRDTDMAKEMMNMTKANVLQQAATSMLAQANQAPQAILKLLG